MSVRIIDGIDQAKLGNIARDCEMWTSAGAANVILAHDKLVALGCLPDDRRQFDRFYRENALIDAAKLLMPDGFFTTIDQHRENWTARAARYDDRHWIIRESLVKATAINEHLARTAMALKAWVSLTRFPVQPTTRLISVGERALLDPTLGYANGVEDREKCLPMRGSSPEYEEGYLSGWELNGLSDCDTCGAVYPSARPGVIHKCQCSGGMMKPRLQVVK